MNAQEADRIVKYTRLHLRCPAVKVAPGHETVSLPASRVQIIDLQHEFQAELALATELLPAGADQGDIDGEQRLREPDEGRFAYPARKPRHCVLGVNCSMRHLYTQHPASALATSWSKKPAQQGLQSWARKHRPPRDEGQLRRDVRECATKRRPDP